MHCEKSMTYLYAHTPQYSTSTHNGIEKTRTAIHEEARQWYDTEYHIQMNEGHSHNFVSFIVLALSSNDAWMPGPLPWRKATRQQIILIEQEREPEQYHGWSQAIAKLKLCTGYAAAVAFAMNEGRSWYRDVVLLLPFLPALIYINKDKAFNIKINGLYKTAFQNDIQHFAACHIQQLVVASSSWRSDLLQYGLRLFVRLDWFELILCWRDSNSTLQKAQQTVIKLRD